MNRRRNVTPTHEERLEFARQLPKVELNARLTGSLTSETLSKLGCSRRAIAECERLSKVRNTTKTLADCHELFKEAKTLLKTPKAVYIATTSVIEDFVKDNVIYLELRTRPKAADEMSKQEYIEAIVQAIQDRDFRNFITVKLILSIDRRHSKAESNDNMDLILQMSEKYPEIIKGVNLIGDPGIGDFDASLFRRAREGNLRITLPCGEVVNDQEVERILTFQPDRISDGVFIHPARGGSLENYELYLTTKLPIESCLTSNVICKQVKSYWNNPIRHWTINQPFAICTENKGVFGTTLSREYAHFYHYYDMEPIQLWQVAYNSIGYSFASQEEKSRIRMVLTKWLFDYSASLKFELDPEYDVSVERRRLDRGSNQL